MMISCGGLGGAGGVAAGWVPAGDVDMDDVPFRALADDD